MLFQQLAGQVYYTKVNNLSVYRQLKLNEASSRVTAIISHTWGVYRFLSRDPFGILTASGEYQARMAHQVLEGFYLNGAIVYMDKTVIYRKNDFWKC